MGGFLSSAAAVNGWNGIVKKTILHSKRIFRGYVEFQGEIHFFAAHFLYRTG
ncbi:hypothetical protein BN871_DF_00420 [Paenibacillus sp. P22]|nr:hypothetical protein BN871_DF_00420 [Paenibacillus sp. P22]